MKDFTPLIPPGEMTDEEHAAYTEFRIANKVRSYTTSDRSNFIHGYRAAKAAQVAAENFEPDGLPGQWK